MRSLLINNFKFIFSHLVTNGEQEDLNTASIFLKVSTLHACMVCVFNSSITYVLPFTMQCVGGFDMTALLHTDARTVLNVLLLNLCTHRTRVLAGVKILASIKQTINLDSEEHVVSVLRIFCLY